MRLVLLILIVILALDLVFYIVNLLQSSLIVIFTTLVMLLVLDILQLGLVIYIFRATQLCEVNMTKLYKYVIEFKQPKILKILHTY